MSWALPLVLATSTLVACGGADSSQAKSPARAEDVSDPQTIEEAQERIAEARRRLEPGAAESAERVDKADAEPRPAPTEAAPKSPRSGADDAVSQRERPEHVCGGSCRALASMKRAVVALCRMTGEADQRCADAKRTLDESATRVSSCRCDAH